MTSYIDIVNSQQYRDLCAHVACLVGHDGSGDHGIIVAQAIADNPQVTAAEIADIIHEARAEAQMERDRA